MIEAILIYMKWIVAFAVAGLVILGLFTTAVHLLAVIGGIVMSIVDAIAEGASLVLKSIDNAIKIPARIVA